MIGKYETYVATIFSFFSSALCWENSYQSFTLDHFEIIRTSNDTSYIRNTAFSNDQQIFMHYLYDNGNLIKLMEHYHAIKDRDDNFYAQEILEKLLAMPLLIEGYSAINNNFARKRFYILQALASIISGNYSVDSENLKIENIIQTTNFSSLVNEKGETGLMLAIKTGNDVIFELFFKYYQKQQCPLNARAADGKTAYDLAQEIGTPAMQKSLGIMQFIDR